MNHKTVEDYVLSMPNAVREYPFGEDVAVYKTFVPSNPGVSHLDAAQGGREERIKPYKSTVKNAPEQANTAMHKEGQQTTSFARGQADTVRGEWKMFALIAEGTNPLRLSLKCDPQLSVILRGKYETVLEGYHLNKKHWNTIILTGQLPWEEIQGFIRHSYDLVTGAKHAIPTAD